MQQLKRVLRLSAYSDYHRSNLPSGNSHKEFFQALVLENVLYRPHSHKQGICSRTILDLRHTKVKMWAHAQCMLCRPLQQQLRVWDSVLHVDNLWASSWNALSGDLHPYVASQEPWSAECRRKNMPLGWIYALRTGTAYFIKLGIVLGAFSAARNFCRTHF